MKTEIYSCDVCLEKADVSMLNNKMLCSSCYVEESIKEKFDRHIYNGVRIPNSGLQVEYWYSDSEGDRIIRTGNLIAVSYDSPLGIRNKFKRFCYLVETSRGVVIADGILKILDKEGCCK